MRILTAIVALFVASSFAFAADEGAKESSDAHHKGPLYHCVSLKFKASAQPDQIKKAVDTFAALKGQIPGITSLHWGTNVSPEKRNKGYTHCFVLTFASDKDRDTYLTHPAHQALGKVLGPVLDDVMVIDFWAQE